MNVFSCNTCGTTEGFRHLQVSAAKRGRRRARVSQTRFTASLSQTGAADDPLIIGPGAVIIGYPHS